MHHVGRRLEAGASEVGVASNPLQIMPRRHFMGNCIRGTVIWTGLQLLARQLSQMFHVGSIAQGFQVLLLFDFMGPWLMGAAGSLGTEDHDSLLHYNDYVYEIGKPKS